MAQKINNRLGDMNIDNGKIRSVCDGLLRDYRDWDEAIGNLTRLVMETLDRPVSHQPHRDAVTPHPIVQPDLIDDEGNLRAANIGITWQESETFLHGVRVVGPNAAGPPLRSRRRRLMFRCGSMSRVTCRHHHQYSRRAWRSRTDHHTGPHRRVVRATDRLPRFSVSITRVNWLSWFRHFKAVEDVHGWDKDQRTLQLLSRDSNERCPGTSGRRTL